MNGNDDLLLQLQEGLPLVVRPFDAVAERAGLDGREVISALEELKRSGRMRRFGAVFDSRRLGYSSTLCAMSVPAAEIDDAVAPLKSDKCVTHCYERDCDLNIWFTYTAPRDEMPQCVERLQSRFSRWTLHNLPALRRFKVNVIFGNRSSSSSQVERDILDHSGLVEPLGEQDREIVRLLQGDIPLCRDFFDSIAGSAGLDVDSLLKRLRSWQESGLLRRIGALLFHYKLGFSANGMCVWDVQPEAIEDVGRSLAACREVSHCYERRSFPEFPYNLYAMIHAQSISEAEAICDRLSRDVVGASSNMLLSTREFVKRSALFFV